MENDAFVHSIISSGPQIHVMGSESSFYSDNDYWGERERQTFLFTRLEIGFKIVSKTLVRSPQACEFRPSKITFLA